MSKTVSIQEKVELCRSLKPHDLTAWEQNFMESIERAALSDRVGELTDKQLNSLNTLYEKHFKSW